MPLDGEAYSNDLTSPLPPADQAPSLWRRVGAAVRIAVLPRVMHQWPTAAEGYDTTGRGWAFLAAHPLRGR